MLLLRYLVLKVLDLGLKLFRFDLEVLFVLSLVVFYLLNLHIG